ncbi:type II toxin-antitoxin system RelE/ParE family toxin [Halocola ammonii]
MSYSIIISESAEVDVRDAFLWYEKQQSKLGERFERRIESAIENIKDNPLKIEVKYGNVRIFFLKKFPYGIHFTVARDEILIVSVFHTSRDPKKWTPL